MTLDVWLAARLPGLLKSRTWPQHDTLSGERVQREVMAVQSIREDDGVVYKATWRLIIWRGEAVTDIKEMTLGAGFLPNEAAPLAVPDDIELVVDRWMAAVDEAAVRLWRVVDYPGVIMPGDLLRGVPWLVNLIVAHTQQGPATPRPMALTPREAPLALEVAAAGKSPVLTVLASPDTIELHVREFRDYEIVVRTPEARAVMLRQEGGWGAVIGGQVEEVRAVLCWLAESVRAAGDPIADIIDPDEAEAYAEDEEEVEVYPTLLSGLLDELASTAWLDWRIEEDSLARARTLPDRPGHRRAWAAFLSRHFH